LSVNALDVVQLYSLERMVDATERLYLDVLAEETDRL
jgi:hypothetical protein